MTQVSAPTLGRARVGPGCVGAAESYISLHSPEALFAATALYLPRQPHPWAASQEESQA